MIDVMQVADNVVTIDKSGDVLELLNVCMSMQAIKN